MKQQLIDQVKEALGDFPSGFEFNGQFYRFGNKKKFWVVGHEIRYAKEDIYVIHFGDWSSDFKNRIFSKKEYNAYSDKLLPRKIRTELRRIHAVLQVEKEEAHKRCIEKWKPIFNGSQAGAHHYLHKKGVGAFCSRIYFDREHLLLVPVMNISQEFMGVQKISQEGGKFFAEGSKISGNFCALSEISPDKIFYISEGFATAASIQEAAESDCSICAFSCHNLPDVAKIFREQFPKSKIIICADNDPRGTGEKQAQLASNYLNNCTYILPTRPDGNIVKDFNDLHAAIGINEVKRQLKIATEQFTVRDFSADIERGFTKSIKDGTKNVKDHVRLAEYYCSTRHCVTIRSSGVIYAYLENLGCFRRMEELELKSFAQEHFAKGFENFCLESDAIEFLNCVRRLTTAEALSNSTQSSGEFINLLNGVYSVKKNILLAHSPKFGFTHCIPHHYIPDATCPTWDLALNNMLSGDISLVSIIEEYLGFILTNEDYCKHNKALILDGEGANGKTTLINFIREIVGPNNTSSIAIHNLYERRFNSSSLVDSLVNISEEEPPELFKKPEVFKQLVGGSTIFAERKMERGFQFTNKAKLIISYNKLPIIKDADLGLRRRLMIIPCIVNFIDRKDLQIDQLPEKLKLEASGVINKAIEGAIRLRNQSAFTSSNASTQRLNQILKGSDFFGEWWSTHIEITESYTDKIFISDMHQHFIDHFKDSKYSIELFGKSVSRRVDELSRDYWNISHKQIRIGDNTFRGVVGIKFKSV